MSLLERIRGEKKFWAHATPTKIAPPLPKSPRTAELSAKPYRFRETRALAREEMPGTVVDEIDEYRGQPEGR